MTTENQPLNPQLKTELGEAAVQMARAKALIDEGELIKKGVKATILPLMKSFEVKGHEVAGLGKLSCRSGGGSSLDKVKLTELLLKEGLDAARIPQILKAATKTWAYDYVEFKGATRE